MYSWRSSTALHFASELGRVDIVTLLLDAGAKLDLQDVEGNTPLHIAIDKSHHKVTRLLLAHKPPPRLNLQGMQQLTPLAFASLKGDIEIVRLLLQQQPAPDLNMRDKWGASVRPRYASGFLGFV